MIARKATKSKSIHPLAIECVMLKDRLGRAGLFKTMQKMEDVVTAVGWEIAEQINRDALVRCGSIFVHG